MIGKIYGKLEEINQDHLLVKTNAGIAYIIYCSEDILIKSSLGEDIELFIQTHIAEDKMDLYGFIDKDNKLIFNLLNSVKGIGKKTALNILAKASKYEIQNSLLEQNSNFFKQMSGIGKSTSERIVTELKNKIPIFHSITEIANINNDIMNDAISALVKLGIKKEKAFSKVQKILKEHENINLNELIKLSLKNLL
ncbi:MAG: Holliday junction branch migration protein RuvA [Rickettsia sp.]|nr:Holliday junction branch migration protein RuvA [Rickettsia sp.]